MQYSPHMITFHAFEEMDYDPQKAYIVMIVFTLIITTRHPFIALLISSFLLEIKSFPENNIKKYDKKGEWQYCYRN